MSRSADLLDVVRRVAEGRGQGTGKDYQPYLRVQDVPSHGQSARIKGWTTGRTHHLLSQLEQRYIYLLDWSPVVTDIREQYPLLDGTAISTLTVAEELGLRHPQAYRRAQATHLPRVITTDFVVTIQHDGGRKVVARAVKPRAELHKCVILPNPGSEWVSRSFRAANKVEGVS